MQIYYIKRGDEGTVIEAVLSDDLGAVDLSGTSIEFSMRDGSTVVTGAATPDADQVTNKGLVSYTFAAGDVDVAGYFLAEFEVTFSGGAVSTFPRGTSPHLLVVVQQDEATTALSAQQVDDVREICQLPSFSQTQSLLAGMNDAQLVKIAIVIEEWRVIHRKHVNFRGKGVDLNYQRYRQQIMDEMRFILGLPPLQFQFLIPSGASRNVPQW